MQKPEPSSLSDLMDRSEKSGRSGQIFTDFKSIAEAIDAESRGNMKRFPLFAADQVKSDRLLDQRLPIREACRLTVDDAIGVNQVPDYGLGDAKTLPRS